MQAPPAGGTLSASVTDSATIGETVTARMAAALSVSVSDAATITETVTAAFPGTATAPTIVSGVTTAVRGNSDLFLDINVPTYAEGDEIFVGYASDGNLDTATMDGTGWTTVYDNVALATDQGVFCLWRRTAGSEPATYRVTNTISEYACMGAWAVRNFNGINASATNGSGTTSPATINSVTSTVTDCLRISIVTSHKDAHPCGTPSGHDVVLDHGRDSGGTFSVFSKALPSSGTDTAVTSTLTTVFPWTTVAFAIAPTAGGGPPAARTVNATDSASTSETVTVQPLTLPGANVTDAASIAETVTLRISTAASVSDSATITETVAVTPLAVRASVADAATTGETVIVTPLALPGASVADSATLADTPTVRLGASVNVSDSATIADAAAAHVRARWQNPEALTITAGAISSGTLADTWSDNNTELVLTETIGSPGFDYSFTFYDVVPAATRSLLLRGEYDGNPAHDVKLYAWNFTGSTWTALTGNTDDMPSSATEQTYRFPLPYGTDYISSGEMRLRIAHTSPGNPIHLLHIDELALDSTLPSTCPTRRPAPIRLRSQCGRQLSTLPMPPQQPIPSPCSRLSCRE